MRNTLFAVVAGSFLVAGSLIQADDVHWSTAAGWTTVGGAAPVPPAEETSSEETPLEAPLFDTSAYLAPYTGQMCCDGILPCDAVGCPDGPGCRSDDCWLFSDEPLLNDLRGQTLFGDVKYSVGGELRHRYMDERNRLRPQGTQERDTYQLWRFTPFMEVGNDWIKGYVQGIDASSFGEDIPPLPIDVNRWDLLQYYVDVKLLELESGDIRGQYGRIFLKYGDQHLVSPLGWCNTYRNFEGGRLYYSGDEWDIDGFVTRPSNGAASASTLRAESFDQPDQSILFSGIYATYKKARHGAVDFYWLWNKEDEPSFAAPFGFNRQDGNRHTFGARYFGSIPVKDCGTVVRTWDWDVQGAWQVGEDDFQATTDQDVSAGFLFGSGGITFDDTPWTPQIKGLFWWGSGDDDPTDGEIKTVNTLYPLGHAYWGQIDNFNGANLIDYSVQLSVKPAKKMSLAAHMHWFDKANENDFIYNIAGAPLGGTNTTDRHIGNELDLLATYQVNKNLQLQAGYFWFWYGDAVDNQPALQRDDAQQFYFMTTFGF